MPERVIMSEGEIRRALVRIAHEAVEANGGCEDMVLIGIHTRGVPLAERIAAVIEGFEKVSIPVGALEIGPHRDDIPLLAARPVARPNHIPTEITGKNIVLVDDVLFTGRSIRAALDAIVDMGRPRRIFLAVLIDRGHRELPIKANFVGKNIPSYRYERIQLRLRETDGKDEVVIVDPAKAGTLKAQN
ncbi:MAG: bifunctional pyr operon transcriptional regulator/uracil phosphoribosyltransferase PyrR [Dehalococcoidia bacterium]|nr:bifunctional pyr operon transcriptional regulator/uracil phosphoribosyltransferase PyrR [Dehalococcoidia bacterium]